MYNDTWLFEQGLVDRPHAGSVVDLIVRRYAEGSAVTVAPQDSLLHAYRRMKLFDVSQLPVMNGEQLAGIVDESDLIQHVALDPTRFHDPVATAMVTALKTVRPNAAIAELIPVIAQGHVAIRTAAHGFVGSGPRIHPHSKSVGC